MFRVEGRVGVVTEISTGPEGRTWVGNGSVLAFGFSTSHPRPSGTGSPGSHVGDLVVALKNSGSGSVDYLMFSLRRSSGSVKEVLGFRGFNCRWRTWT